MIDFGKEAEVDERDLLNELLEFVSTEVKELGSEEKWRMSSESSARAPARTGNLLRGNARQDMKAVVDHIVVETYDGLSLPE